MEAMLFCISLFIGVPTPSTLPAVVYWDRQNVIDAAHDGDGSHNALAYYLPGTKVIVMGVSGPGSEYVLAHEATHYLQDLNGLPFSENQAWDGSSWWLSGCSV